MERIFVASIQPMRITNRKDLVQITATYKPKIKTIKQVMYETGRLRQQIEKNTKLTFGIVLNDDLSGDLGQKVVIDDQALQEFIDKCKAKDKKAVAIKKPSKTPPKKKAVKKAVKKSKLKTATPKKRTSKEKIAKDSTSNTPSSISSLIEEVDGYGE